jgi:hypothetical protein
MRRPLFIAFLAIIAVSLPATASATPPEGYRVISYRHAHGGFSVLDGCFLTEAFFGSTRAKYGNRPGRVYKQAGPTDLLMTISDTCAEPVGKHFPPVHSWTAQVMVGLESSAQFDRAWVHASLPVVDEVTGVAGTAVLDLRWRAVTRAKRNPSHVHECVSQDDRCGRHEAIAIGHDNDTIVDAIATGTITLGGVTYEIWTDSAHLSSVKAGCQVIVHPHASTDVECV